MDIREELAAISEVLQSRGFDDPLVARLDAVIDGEELIQLETDSRVLQAAITMHWLDADKAALLQLES